MDTYMIRGYEVVLDRDLAAAYGVKTKRINQIIKRNESRVPEDFCFRLTKGEFSELMSRCGTKNQESKTGAIENLTSHTGTSVPGKTSAERHEEFLTGDDLWTEVAHDIGRKRGHESRNQNYGGIRKPPMVYTIKGTFLLACLLSDGLATESLVDTISAIFDKYM